MSAAVTTPWRRRGRSLGPLSGASPKPATEGTEPHTTEGKGFINKMAVQLPSVSLLVPVITRLVYAIYTGLAIVAYKDAQHIFDEDAASCDDGMCRIPIVFCKPKISKVTVSDAGEFHAQYSGEACMDAGPITNIVSVTAVVSLAAVFLYVILDLVVRCRKGCFQALGGVSAGVAAGFGVALSILLFLSMWCFFTVGTICN